MLLYIYTVLVYFFSISRARLERGIQPAFNVAPISSLFMRSYCALYLNSGVVFCARIMCGNICERRRDRGPLHKKADKQTKQHEYGRHFLRQLRMTHIFMRGQHCARLCSMFTHATKMQFCKWIALAHKARQFSVILCSNAHAIGVAFCMSFAVLSVFANQFACLATDKTGG